VTTANRRSTPTPLTPRELEILARVAEGCSNRTIAQRYGISEQTVKNHLAKILQRLQVPDRTAAVVTSLRNGWLDLNSIEVTQRGESRKVA
jgi:two-component system, NarL family, response regulator DegU